MSRRGYRSEQIGTKLIETAAPPLLRLEALNAKATQNHGESRKISRASNLTQ